jgi:hypothetical protein
MQSDAATAEEYLAALPEDRREILSRVREVILAHLPDGYEEGMQYGMISYFVPLSRYPTTYNGQALSYVALASQKNYVSLYLTSIYGNGPAEAWFREEYAKSGKKPNMGKSCVRFKKLEDLPLDLVGRAVALESVDDFLQRYEASRK